MARTLHAAEGRAFSGSSISVALPPTTGGYRVRPKPTAKSPVAGHLQSVWLCEASFVSLPRVVRCFVVGTVLRTRPRKLSHGGWTVVRLHRGKFYDGYGTRELRGAKYVRLERGGAIYAMGIEPGEAIRSTRNMNPRSGLGHLQVYNPDRSTWTGEMGGINHRPPTSMAVSEALAKVWEDHPGAVVIDGTDDWFAPEWVRPELFVEMFGICPLALWHTGASGKSTSGLVLEEEEYERLSVMYRQSFGYYLEQVPSEKRRESHSTCGCWDGSAFLIYHDPKVRPGSWSPPG